MFCVSGTAHPSCNIDEISDQLLGKKWLMCFCICCRSLEPVTGVDDKEKEFNEDYDRGKTKKIKGIGQANIWSTGEGNLFTESFMSRKKGRGGKNYRSPGKRTSSLG